MRTLIGTLLGVIALGVVLIAYGLLTPRVATADAYQLARPGFERVSLTTDTNRDFANDRAAFAGDAAGAPLQLRCEPGQRAVIRQVAGAASAECLDDAYAPRATRAALTYPVSALQTAPERVVYRQAPAPRRATTARVEKGRDWQKTAMVIGGSSAAGAGIGALFGGKKGALIGAAIGGGASTLYEVKH
jgi:predicted ABC-type sugar transport system permease subunit